MSQAGTCPDWDGDGEEISVKTRMFIFLALTMLAVSACVVEPGGYYGGGYYGGGYGYYEGDHGGGHERGVWRR